MKRLTEELLLDNASGVAQEVVTKKQPMYITIDLSHDHCNYKPTQNWQSKGKRRKPRIK